MSQKQAEMTFSGNVQGVGFRWAAQDAAYAFNIVGWVANCLDGTVEIVCEGEEEDIGLFLDKIKDVMKRNIKAVNIKWKPAKGKFDSFNIRFS